MIEKLRITERIKHHVISCVSVVSNLVFLVKIGACLVKEQKNRSIFAHSILIIKHVINLFS